MDDGDYMIFVKEETNSLTLYPVLFNENVSDESYFNGVMFAVAQLSVKSMIQVKGVDTSITRDWKRQMDLHGIDEGIHIFKYVNDNLIIMTKDGMILLDNN
jgi:hypothetical protein